MQKQCRKKLHFYDSKFKSCPECERKYNQLRYLAKKEEISEYNKAYAIANKECKSEYQKQYYIENKSLVAAVCKEWRQNNRGSVNAIKAKRRAAKLQATPKWLTDEQLAEIKEFYLLAKELQWLSDPSDPLEVDHIAPLQCENSSGLHVPWNLQILPRSLNRSKGYK